MYAATRDRTPFRNNRDVRFGSKADVCGALGDVRFVPLADLCAAAKKQRYSITSARASSVGGIVRPINFATFRLMTSSNVVGCSIGKSAALAP